ncbi:transposase [Streptomyces sp. NPDC001667]
MARAAFPKGSLPIRVRDRLAGVFADEPFAGSFGVRGAPGGPPAVLSLVTVLQFTENLTGRQAAEAARERLLWKYALGMELADAGFDFTVLSKFRARLTGHGLERVVFGLLVDHCRQAGLIGAGGKQRTGSTHVISAVRDLNRLELAGESVRAALEALAVVAPAWLAEQVDVTEFAYRYGPRINGWTMPSSETRRDRLAQVFAQDGYAVVRAAFDADAPVWIRDVEAVQVLRQVLVQTYYARTDSRGREAIIKRDANEDGVPPGRSRLASPYDPDTRWAAKGEGLFWCGYKIHLTESCDTPPEAEAEARRHTGPRPNLITVVHTTDATVPDVKATAGIQHRLAARNLAPGEHYLDAGYLSADLHAAAKNNITMITPLMADHSPQARAGQGFAKSNFRIDWRSRTVRCPEGSTSTGWHPVTQHQHDAIVVEFDQHTYRACPSQQRCTTPARGSGMLTLRPEEAHEALTRARTEQKSQTWKDKYALRTGIEGTINQALDITGIRRARYRGLPKVRLQHAFSATAISIVRLDAHWTDQPLRRVRTSRLERLACKLTA